MDSVPKSVLHRHGRRLCELLEEQQEPFLLDAYLLRHGYSDRAADAAACVCWLGSACTRLKMFSDYGLKRKKKKKKKKKKTEVIRHVLAKIACNRVIRRAWRRNAAVIDGLLKAKNHGVEFHRLSSSAATDEAEMDKEERSPVSVLALHSHGAEEESTSPSSFESTEEAKNSSGILEEYCLRELEESLRVNCDGIVDLSQLIACDLSESNKEWSQFERERSAVGAEIEHIIFEEIRQETALDLLLHCNCTLRPSVDSTY